MREIRFREAMSKDGEFHHFEYWGWHNPKTREFTPPRNYSNAVWKTGISEQYTGLHDNNDREIYEFDILEHYSGLLPKGSNQMVRQVVKWNRLRARFENCHPEARIIGNVHENPELLENS